MTPFQGSIVYLGEAWAFTGATDTRYWETGDDAYAMPVGEYRRADGATVWADAWGAPFYDDYAGEIVITPGSR